MEENLELLGNSGFVPRLIDVVQSAGRDAVGQACAALRHLATFVPNRTIMLEANVFEAFATVVVNDDVEALREVGAACCLLTFALYVGARSHEGII